jgi:hypothetical protein
MDGVARLADEITRQKDDFPRQKDRRRRIICATSGKDGFAAGQLGR